MHFELARHAKDALVKREISMEWLERTLKFPDLTEPDMTDHNLEHRLAMISEHGCRVLRVMALIIISATSRLG